MRLPVEELVPLVQLASMLARTLREHRRREGRLAHDYAEHAARLHDRAEQVPVRELTADEQRERWVRASEQAWGSELRLSNADLDQPVGQGTETLLERLQTLSKESGCPPTAVLAAVAAPVGAGRADGIAQQLQHISLPQSTESQVWREKLAEGEVVVGWMPIDEGTSSLMFEVKALDEEWAARAAEAMWEGLGAGEEAEQTMAGLQRAAAVGTAVYNGNAEYPTASASVPSAIPRIEISRAELADALKAQLGDFTGTAIAGCKAYPALHRVVENELNAGGSLGELIGRMDGINVNRARKPAALALHMMRNPVIDDDPLESPATAGSRRVPAKTAERIKTRWRGEDGDERISTSDALRNVENVRKRAVWLREFSADELRQAASRVGEAAQTTGGLTPDQMARTLESVFGDRATRAGAALED
ncbi:hypothetical protein, partial [Amycolatopsis sp. NPDC051903]|uniref:hypothetical protein n=1 Tax=Amycolatopsis sp. NPDC051903 TaxID=3363936 RepID=UPI00379CB9E7